MLKRDYFIAAMKAECFLRLNWVTRAFAIVQEGPDDWKQDPYPYRLVQTPTGNYYVNPDNQQELIKLDETADGQDTFKPNKPAFVFTDPITVTPDDVPNLDKTVESRYGIVLLNYTVFVWPFGKKMAFINGPMHPRKVEALILPRLRDNPENDADRDDRYLYIDELLKFNDASIATGGWSQLAVPGGTEKAMTVSPEIAKLRAELLEKFKDRLRDPATIAQIDAILVAADKEWMKGDKAMGYLITGKSFDTVRRKLFLMMGAERGLGESVEVDLIPKPLVDGWDITHFPAMNNSLRAGSYNRGHQTMLGGELVKWLHRASSNVSATVDDCGSVVGLEVNLTKDNLHRHLGNSFVVKGAAVRLTEENAEQYLGKLMFERTPMACLAPGNTYCKTCVGGVLGDNPTGLSSAIATEGSTIMYIYMSAAHAKNLKVEKLDWQHLIF